MSDLPACVDCVHFRGSHGAGGCEDMCAHESCSTFDIVVGREMMRCRTARHDACGLRGTLFKKRGDRAERIIGWLVMAAAAFFAISVWYRMLG